jgi:type VI secretion system secreted protein Hcp
MKHIFSILAALAIILAATLSARAQGSTDAFIQIKGAGGTYTSKLDPAGNATISNVKPGTYSVALLLPAVQKVREAAVVPSESSEKHEKWIEVQSWSWGASNPTTIGSQSTGAGTGKASMSDMTMMKTSDKGTAAPPAMQQPVPPTRKQLDKTVTQNNMQFYIVKLSEIVVTGLQQGSSSGDDRPTESLSLNFTKITYKYGEQK